MTAPDCFRPREGIVNLDCLDTLLGLPALPDRSIDVTITDPPYEAQAHLVAMRAKKGRMVRLRLPFAPMTEDVRVHVSREIARVTRRGILVFCQVEASHLWIRALEAGGAEYLRTMIWIKPNPQPQLSGDRPGMGYESIVFAYRRGRKRWNGGGRSAVFKHASAAPGVHPTAKPLSLMRELVGLFSDPGEIVLDPFAGSGTTGVACAMQGRRFLGYEIDPTYAEIAARRLAGDEAIPTPGQVQLFGGRT